MVVKFLWRYKNLSFLIYPVWKWHPMVFSFYQYSFSQMLCNFQVLSLGILSHSIIKSVWPFKWCIFTSTQLSSSHVLGLFVTPESVRTFFFQNVQYRISYIQYCSLHVFTTEAVGESCVHHIMTVQYVSGWINHNKLGISGFLWVRCLEGIASSRYWNS